MIPFTLSRFSEVLQRLPVARRYWVAYSGGCDSHVLLHALAALRDELRGRLAAVHVNHGLSPSADRWAAHCRLVCRRLGVPLKTVAVDARPRRGESPEATARRVRYEAFESLLAAGDCLFTAHHQDDQAETLLLQLLRGCGPHGLAGMPFCALLGAGWLLRPLLGFRRAALAAYARAAELEWVEDESNFDTGVRRNFLRHQVFPLLEGHWPAAAVTLSRSARHCAEAVVLLDELAGEDLEDVADARDRTRLAIPALQRLSPARRRNLLRYWCRNLGLPLPQAAHLEHIEQDLLAAAADRQPEVRWADVVLRRHRQWLYILPPQADFDNTVVLTWELSRPLALPGGGMLLASEAVGQGLARRYGRRVTVRFRRGGERCLMAHGRHRSLKKLLQELDVPPWERDRMPLLYVGDQLAAVADLWLCQDFRAADDEPGWLIAWQRAG